MDATDLFVALAISIQLVAESIIVSASRKLECVLAGVHIVNGMVPPDPHRPQTRDYVLDFVILGESTHISYAPSLSFDILDKWSINTLCSTSCVRLEHVMVFPIVFSVLVYLG
jgi:hypothetical protein